MNKSYWFFKKENILTILIFLLLFIFSLDFWGWHQSVPLILGMPLWVYYSFILTIFTSVLFYLFSSKYWRENK